MRKLSDLPLVWGGATLIGLLLLLAVAVLIVGRGVEREAAFLKTDSVPGSIDGHTIRSAYSKGFVCATLLLEADRPEEAQSFLRQMAQWDDLGRAACDDYVNTIHIDPQQDGANYHSLLGARDRYLQTRAQYLSLVQAGRKEAARSFLLEQLTPTYDVLVRACDTLVLYNNRTSTLISSAMTIRLAQLRWTVVAIVALALIAGVSMRSSLASRRRVERSLRQSDEILAAAFQFSPNSMVISRFSDGQVIAANEVFKNRYGLIGTQVVGKSTVELRVWHSAAEREALVDLLRRDGRVRNFVRERYLPGGRRMNMLLSVERIRVENEDCMLSVGQDVSELANAEEALARSTAELRVMFESAAIGIALLNSEGRPIRSNPALERFLGYRSDELTAMTFAQFTHPDDVADDWRQFGKLVAGEANFYQLEKRYLRKDGTTAWGHLTVSAVRGDDEKLAYAVSMVEDVSEQREAALALRTSEAARQTLQEQLIVAQKLEAVGQLAGGVAHDFNNILAAIMLHLDLLKSDPSVSPSVQDSLGELVQATRRAAGLTRQLLLFSRREPAQRQVIDLNVVVSNLLRMLDRLVGEHLSLVHAEAPRPLWVFADPGMLDQVVMNLVVNARDAMPRGGRIVLRTEATEVDAAHALRVSAGQAGPFVRLTVSDTGCGMNAATRARIFEPFFTTKEAGKGTGLGLSTVFGIVQQHAGWIEVESTEGVGTSFAIYLPPNSRPPPVRAVETPAPSVVKGREIILVAEDNEPVRRATVRILRLNGYRVLEAADGHTAEAILEAHPGEVDLLLSDVVMPGGLMGHELAAGVLAGGNGPKVILMSGHSTHVDLSILDSAASAYLAKPFDADRLLRIVRDTLDAGA